MTEEQIFYNNTCIAKFMGYEIERDYAKHPIHGSWTEIDNMYYHYSWDWLMPVVDNISKIIIKGYPPFNTDELVKIEIVTTGYVKISNLKDKPITTNISIEGSLINAIYKAVVEFIKWHEIKSNIPC